MIQKVISRKDKPNLLLKSFRHTLKTKTIKNSKPSFRTDQQNVSEFFTRMPSFQTEHHSFREIVLLNWNRHLHFINSLWRWNQLDTPVIHRYAVILFCRQNHRFNFRNFHQHSPKSLHVLVTIKISLISAALLMKISKNLHRATTNHHQSKLTSQTIPELEK